ncbi:MAG: VacJ family lipoprotein [Hyphomicrobiales bacterium]|nr:VacJ family lipoprotein [Hyphomicrobiales bacterium]
MKNCYTYWLTSTAIVLCSVTGANTAKAVEGPHQQKAIRQMLNAASPAKGTKQRRIPRLEEDASEHSSSSVPEVQVRANGYHPIPDPLEGLNRKVFEFNETMDETFLSPVARTYRNAVPEWGRYRVGNVLSNLGEPVNFVNSILQGDVESIFTSFWRFTLNTTLGLGGLFDQASSWGLKEKRRDFDQTLANYGVGTGPYLVLPFFGPSTARGTVGRLGDVFADASTYASWPVAAGYRTTDIIHTRSEYLDLVDDIRRDSFDPYATFKSAYTQRRAKLIENKK